MENRSLESGQVKIGHFQNLTSGMKSGMTLSREPSQLTYLLLQVRNPEDPIRQHEIDCFALALSCPTENIQAHDLISRHPDRQQIDQVDAVLIGGSGDFSVARGGPWLPAAMSTFQDLHQTAKPTFASCWGFQAFARALGGEVVHDLSRAELGTLEMSLTQAGQEDPIFGPLGSPFCGQLGHEDIVDRLPADAIRLASSEKVENQAFTFAGKPIYCTQFHPELECHDLVQRLAAYPSYLEKIMGWSIDEFRQHCHETPETVQLLSRFADYLYRLATP